MSSWTTNRKFDDGAQYQAHAAQVTNYVEKGNNAILAPTPSRRSLQLPKVLCLSTPLHYTTLYYLLLTKLQEIIALLVMQHFMK